MHPQLQGPDLSGVSSAPYASLRFPSPILFSLFPCLSQRRGRPPSSRAAAVHLARSAVSAAVYERPGPRPLSPPSPAGGGGFQGHRKPGSRAHNRPGTARLEELYRPMTVRMGEETGRPSGIRSSMPLSLSLTCPHPIFAPFAALPVTLGKLSKLLQVLQQQASLTGAPDPRAPMPPPPLPLSPRGGFPRPMTAPERQARALKVAEMIRTAGLDDPPPEASTRPALELRLCLTQSAAADRGGPHPLTLILTPLFPYRPGQGVSISSSDPHQ